MTTTKKKPVISTDMKKVKELLKNVPDDRKPMANSLYDELLFMQQTMAELKKQVQEEGAVSMFKQGAQEFLREHPALTAYNKTLQRYGQIYKQMLDMLPESKGEDQADELMEFISK